MELSEAIALVENSESFDRTGYLAHGFLSTTQDTEGEWSIGYYDKGTDTITAYEIIDGTVVKHEAAEVFKREGTVLPLNLEDVKVSSHEAVRVATDELLKEHPEHPLQRIIVLTQHIADRQVHNVTIVTKTLHMFNVKIDALNGDVLSSEFSSILSLGRPE